MRQFRSKVENENIEILTTREQGSLESTELTEKKSQEFLSLCSLWALARFPSGWLKLYRSAGVGGALEIGEGSVEELHDLPLVLRVGLLLVRLG